VAGPFANTDKSLFDKDILDPATLDAAAPSDVTADGGAVKWKRFHATDPQGIVDLTQALAPQDACVAYACLEVNLEGEKADRRVSFKIGSDDGVVVWVNGTKIHANNVDRGLGVDSDVVNGRLSPGKNRILVKVINNSGPWQFCFRITDRQGVPMKLEK
jgi:hypothetical protein